MKKILVLLLGLMLVLQSVFADELELNTLKIIDSYGESDTYLAVHKFDETLFFDLCDTKTDDCEAFGAVHISVIEHIRSQQVVNTAAPLLLGIMGAFGLGASIYTGKFDEGTAFSFPMLPIACFWGYGAYKDYRNGGDFKKAYRTLKECNAEGKDAVMETKHYDLFLKQIDAGFVGF